MDDDRHRVASYERGEPAEYCHCQQGKLLWGHLVLVLSFRQYSVMFGFIFSPPLFITSSLDSKLAKALMQMGIVFM